MTSYLETLLSETFAACGEDPKRAQRMASAAVKTLQAVELVPAKSLERFEQDAKIYRLRGLKVRQPELIERLGINPRTIYKALLRHAKYRRAALKVRGEFADGNALEMAG
jgi:hypothetical protein